MGTASRDEHSGRLVADQQRQAHTGDTDLVARHTGSSVTAASDESFGDKENLLNTSPPVFDPGHYGNRGEIVDG